MGIHYRVSWEGGLCLLGLFLLTEWHFESNVHHQVQKAQRVTFTKELNPLLRQHPVKLIKTIYYLVCFVPVEV